MQFTHRDGLKLSTALFNMFWKFRSTFHMQRIAVPVALVPILLIRSVLGDFVKVESRQIAFVQGVRSTLAPFCDYRWALHTWLVKWHLAWAWRAHASHSPSCIFQAEMKALMEGGVPWPSPVGGFAFESCPPRKVSARFDVILGAAALLFVSSALPSARYWTAREIRAVLHHNVMWDCRPGFCYHRGVHAADSAQLGGGYIKELSLLFPTSAAGASALGWRSPYCVVVSPVHSSKWGQNICNLHSHISVPRYRVLTSQQITLSFEFSLDSN